MHTFPAERATTIDRETRVPALRFSHARRRVCRFISTPFTCGPAAPLDVRFCRDNRTARRRRRLRRRGRRSVHKAAAGAERAQPDKHIHLIRERTAPSSANRRQADCQTTIPCHVACHATPIKPEHTHTHEHAQAPAKKRHHSGGRQGGSAKFGSQTRATIAQYYGRDCVGAVWSVCVRLAVAQSGDIRRHGTHTGHTCNAATSLTNPRYCSQ